MLSYQHGFHAGNFADVLKHLIVVRVLQYLTQKDKPLFYLDTHAASGVYPLDAMMAQKTGEYLNGIARLWRQEDLPPSLTEYVRVVREFNGSGDLRRYPGSPSLARQLLRKTDRLCLYELHPTEFASLKRNMRGDTRVRVMQEDGFERGVKLLPPHEKRGFVLIDPPYEIKSDYETAVRMLIKAYRRFATGVYALWYPVVERSRIDQMAMMLQASKVRNVQWFELALSPDSQALGMTASGLFVLNPPWTLKADMVEALPYLAGLLSEQGSYRVEQLVEE